ncbi:hypothetical protein FRC11_013447, partial [Ceratobasidium sp. 423]
VRVALYVQILLGWITSLLWPKTFVKNSRMAYMTALALLIASFIELQTQALSLLDGLVVSFITTMMITFAIASYSALPAPNQTDDKNQSADEHRSITRWFMQLFFVVFWAAWCFNMWSDPAHFGLKADAANCDTNYNVTMQLFTQVHPTDPNVRSAALALVAIGTLTALLSLALRLEQFLVPFFWLAEKFKAVMKTKQTPGQKYDDPVLQAIHVIFQAIAIGTLIFLIYITERTIQNNDVDGTTRDWTYGQTIALILLLQQIMDLFSTYIEGKEEREEREDPNAVAHGDFPGGTPLDTMGQDPSPTPSK